MARHKMSIERLQAMTEQGKKSVMVTAYDYPSAALVEAADIDIILVGDTLAMTVLGYDVTVPVTLDDMLIFMKAVARGAHTPLLVGDLPFGSYVDPREAVRSSVRAIKEGGMDAVKLEGGKEAAEIVNAISRTGIPVMGHVGLTPQTSGAHGGFRVQGRDADKARRLVDDALTLEEAGAFAVVLETIPLEVASEISERLRVPTIGIGSGAECDGQVLVWHDLLNFSQSPYGRHVKRYANLNGEISRALREYAEEVRGGSFPGEEQTWHMPKDELEALRFVKLQTV